MGKIFSIIKPGIRGVDSSRNPIQLRDRLRHAVNLQFQDGRIMTRPVFEYMKLGLRGRFQGVSTYVPSMGISFRPFAPSGARLITAVGGHIFANNAPDNGVRCDPMEISDPDEDAKAETADRTCSGDVHIYQAENYLIISGLQRNTMWWTGEGPMTVSPGMISCEEEDPLAHSGDTFIAEKHKNFLINGAGVGIFWNGMVHQQGPHGIFVGDMIHKRGHLSTDDIILMEDQSKQDSLSTNSRMGALLALEGLPRMDTPNGEGSLIGYYDGGIVEYNTHVFPRLSLFGADGKRLAEGWDTKPMIKHLCNRVTATGRYAVCPLPRDHFFRSGFGVHVLSRVIGVEFINDEPVNIISDEVAGVLDADPKHLLHGAATGYWQREHRWFTTTGMEFDKTISTSPYGRGFVSWNKLWARTEDNTPVTCWEGVWTVDGGIAGIHRFLHTGMREDRGCYGFVASGTDRSLWFAAIRPDGVHDVRDGRIINVGWALETGRFDFNDTQRTKTLVDGRFEGFFRTPGSKVTVYVRTDSAPQWTLWRSYDACEGPLQPGDSLHSSNPLGRPPEQSEEATWFEFRVEGTGAAEITGFDVEFSEGSGKMDSAACQTVHECVNINPLSKAI